MKQYGTKITGFIKINKKVSKSNKVYFQTLLAKNKDYKTKEDLYLNVIVNFKQKEMREMINDGDIIEIIGSLSLSKSNYKDKENDIALFVENVIGFNRDDDDEDNPSNNSEDDEEIETVDELPF